MFTKLHGSAVFVKVLAIMTALLLCLGILCTAGIYARSVQISGAAVPVQNASASSSPV